MKDRIKNVVIFILVSVIIAFSFNYYINLNKSEETISSTTIEERLIHLEELATIKYNYKDIVSYENRKHFQGINIPFTKKSFIITYSGYIKAGVNLDNMDIIVGDDNSIVIKLDGAEIIDNVINEESAEVYDENSGIFNKLNYQELFQVLSEEKAKTKEELINNGFLDEANNRARILLNEILKNIGFENITIEFN